MPSAQDHYANLLARHYTWMVGLSFADKVAEQRALLEPLLRETPRGPAVDLGSGPGFQSLALAQLGFSPVLALDTSAELLAELQAHAAGEAICSNRADMLSLRDYVREAESTVVVCMGDTLTHLPDRDAVRRLFASVAAALAPAGLFLLTWRDLTQELTGDDRFLLVRSDVDKILTCFLEYVSPTTVQVHDLVYTRNPAPTSTSAGSVWTVEKSSYPKLRLSPLWVVAELTSAGLQTRPPASAGRLSLAIGQKPA